MLPATPFTTMSSCASQPEIDRVFGTQVIRWTGHNYLVGNIGNEVKIWRIDSPESPVSVVSSSFNVGNVGDSDYDLLNFSVCDECRWGVANYKRGTVLFDLGTGGFPSFAAERIYSEANIVPGAFTFKHSGQQFLVASNLADGCAGSESTLYKINGVNEASLTKLACLESPDAAATQVVGGLQMGSYLFLGDVAQRVYLYEITGQGTSTRLEYTNTPMSAYMIKDKGLAIDPNFGVAVEANTEGMNIWYVLDPSKPRLRAHIDGDFNRAAVSYPYAWVAKKGYKQSEQTYDITDLFNPVPLDQSFWDGSHPWNHADHQCAETQGATFSHNGPTLYLSRYSVMQVVDFSMCSQAAPPSTSVDVTPEIVFPGDSTSITNSQVGEVERWAIWVTEGADSTGSAVAGTTVLASNNPTNLSFQVPIAVTAGVQYWAHSAVENSAYPYVHGQTPDQLASEPIGIDRSPVVGMDIYPESPLTGNVMRLTAVTEGNPGQSEWTVRDPNGQEQTLFGTPVNYVPSVSGVWTVKLTVPYQHEASSGVTYTATNQRNVALTSVSADFSINPAQPLNNAEVTLDANVSGVGAGAQPFYTWSVTGQTTYGGCPSGSNAALCVIPANMLEIGDYTAKLTLRNTVNQDTSTMTKGFHVSDGHVEPVITWTPNEPEMGEFVNFQIEGVGPVIEVAEWDFGDDGCTGFQNPYTCYAPDYYDCKSHDFQFSTPGAHTVTLSFMINMVDYGPVEAIVNVLDAGECNTSNCNYFLDPDEATFPEDGGEGSVRVETLQGCDWTASTTAEWITITGGAEGSGSGRVYYVVAANTGAERSGAIRIGGRTFPVFQEAAACQYAIDTYNETFFAAGGAGTIEIATAPECTWTTHPMDTWIHITSGEARTGTASATYMVEENPYPSLRKGKIEIGGYRFRIRQEAPVPTHFGINNVEPNIGEVVTVVADDRLIPVSWDFGRESCRDETPFVECSPYPDDACRVMQWAWREPGPVDVTLVTATGEVTRTFEVLDYGECCVASGQPIAEFEVSPNPAIVGETVSFVSSSVPRKVGGALDFSWTPEEPDIGEYVEFSISGADTVESVSWEFDSEGCDGFPETSTCVPYFSDCLRVGHRFAESGLSTVTLNGVVDGQSVEAVSHQVDVGEYGSCTGAGGVGYPDTWNWTIARQGVTVHTSDEPAFDYVFALPGEYKVQLIVSNCRGSDTTYRDVVVVAPEVPRSENFVVPAVIRAAGLNETLWKTDLRIFNPTGQTLRVRLDFLPEGTSNIDGATPGMEFDLAAHATRIFDDLVAAIPGIDSEVAKGSVSLAFATSAGGQAALDPIIMSRTYNDTDDGSFGQFVPIVPVAPGVSEEIFLTGLAENADYRSNVGLANLQDEDAWLRLEVLDASGQVLGQLTPTVPGNSTHQIVQIARAVGAGANLAPFSVRIETFGAQVSAYASVVDNITGDPVLYDFAPSMDEVGFIPGIAHLPGINDSRWRSDVVIFNPSDSNRSVLVEYHPAEDVSDQPVLDVGAMAAFETRDFADIVADLMGEEVESKGYLVLEGVDQNPLPQVVARTYSQDPVAGTFGQNLKVFDSRDLILAGEAAYIAGVSNSADAQTGFRTNLGLLNTDADQWSEVEVTLIDTAGAVIGHKNNWYLAPGAFEQVNLFREFNLGGSDVVATVKVEVVLGGAVAAYGSEVDNRTQDPILLPATKPVG